MKKWFTLFGAALLAFAVVSCGEAKAKKTKIGVSIPAADHGWTGGVIYSAESAMVTPGWGFEFWSPVALASFITVVLYVVGQNLGDASDPRTHM